MVQPNSLCTTCQSFQPVQILEATIALTSQQHEVLLCLCTYVDGGVLSFPYVSDLK